MARLARVVLPGIPHHVTQRGVRSIDIFSSDGDRKYYLDLLQSTSKEFGLEVLSYCLMDNHTHTIVVPDSLDSLQKAIGALHRQYSRMVNFRERKRGFLFQGRFFSCPLDHRHLITAVKYVELNPVRAGMCKQASEYEWSSARYHLGLEKKNPVVKDRQWFGSTEDWKKLLADQPEEIDLLRKHFRTGRPLGDDVFLSEAERITGRELFPKKPGRKKKLHT